MWIITHRRIFYIISAVFILSSVVALSVWGLQLGIDFKGGTLIEVSYDSPSGGNPFPSNEVVRESLAPLSLGDVSVRTTDNGHLIRLRTLDEQERAEVTAILSQFEYASIERFDSVGPLLGREAAEKSLASIVLVLLAIVLFIAFAFRKVSKPVRSWKYGTIALVALFHDVLIPTGVFAVLGHVAGIEVDTLFVTALLVVLGFSVHDTIVVFDRVRENLRIDAENHKNTPFAEIVGRGIEDTLVRSINTSVTTLFSIAALYVFGPESTKLFSLALMIGIVAGTYSSIFLASPLLVTWGGNRKV